MLMTQHSGHRKLHKHLEEKPSLPRHYASKLERNLVACFAKISGAVEVLRQLSIHLRNAVAVITSLLLGGIGGKQTITHHYFHCVIGPGCSNQKRRAKNYIANARC